MKPTKILSLLLCLALVAGLVLPAAAAPPAPYRNHNNCTPGNPCDHSPIIILPGINQSQTFLYVDGQRTNIGGGTVFPDMSAISPRTIASLAGSLPLTLALQRDMGFHRSLYNFTAEIFQPQRIGLDGRPVNDLRTEIIGRVNDMDDAQRHFAINVSVPAHSVIDIVGEDHVFFYAFNLVGCIWKNASGLAEYIDYVREKTGHDRVSLVNVSLGGTVFAAYIEAYGHDKLDQVVNVVSSINGTSMFADLFAMDVDQDPAFLYHHWLPVLMEEISVAQGWDASIGHAVSLLARTLPNDVFHGIFRYAWTAILDTVMINCTQFWAMIPAARYPELAERYLSGPEHAVIRERTDRFHQAQLNLNDNVLAAHRAGVRINNVAAGGLYFGELDYGYFQAVNTRGDINSDGIIDLYLASMGATAAPPSQRLPAGHVPRRPGYLSPCGSIDASTAVLPDNTWIFLNQHHEVGRNDAVLNLVAAFFENPGMNIHTDPARFPQFNPGMNTNDLRRWSLNYAQQLVDSGEMNAQNEAALRAAIREGNAVRALTVGDAARAQAVTAEINDMLIYYGVRGEPFQQSRLQESVEIALRSLSFATLNLYGNQGYSEVLLLRAWLDAYRRWQAGELHTVRPLA